MSKKVKKVCVICKRGFELTYLTKNITPVVCSCGCAVEYYHELPKPKGRAKAREVAAMVGRRSMAEVRFDSEYIEGKTSVHAHYEISQFEYVVDEIKKYTPDWTLIIQPGGHHIYIEYKGVLDGATRKKMKLMKKQHPELDIRFVFEQASNKITKTSKTTYGMWADQWGFPWADNELPSEWLI
jgi:hypothetical protein